MPRRKRKTFKKVYKLKLIEHRVVQVEANSEQDAIDFAVGKKGRDYRAARQLEENRDGRWITSSESVKLTKKTAKVIDERESEAAIQARVNRQIAKELSQELCFNCGKTRAKYHFYDRVTQMYHSEKDLHEYHSVKGLQRWHEMNKETNKERGWDFPTEFTEDQLEHLKELGISVA